MTPAGFVSAVQAALAPLVNSGDAQLMQAYQRDQFEFLGIRAPLRRIAVAKIGKVLFREAELLQAVDALWILPHREYQYVAIDLLASHKTVLRMDTVSHLLDFAQRAPWWEAVDGLADVIGDVIRIAKKTEHDPQRTMDLALLHSSIWVRRIAMTHQLGWRMETDTDRLFEYATALASEKDFFIKKAVGWALRDFAKWNPGAVVEFVTRSKSCLSPLTVREALKNLP